MELRLLQIDTFTDVVLGGNPAAVCPLDAWLDDATMQAIAAENNLSETAFFVPQGEATICGGLRPMSRSTCAAMRPWRRRSWCWKN